MCRIEGQLSREGMCVPVRSSEATIRISPGSSTSKACGVAAVEGEDGVNALRRLGRARGVWSCEVVLFGVGEAGRRVRREQKNATGSRWCQCGFQRVNTTKWPWWNWGCRRRTDDAFTASTLTMMATHAAVKERTGREGRCWGIEGMGRSCNLACGANQRQVPAGKTVRHSRLPAQSCEQHLHFKSAS